MKKEVFSTLGYLLILIALLFCINLVLEKYEFADYLKATYKDDVKTHFYRDNKVKYSDQNSYCIYSEDFNDVFFYKKVKVKKNTAYKVSCMVKTEDVVTERSVSVAGANISIVETSKKSESVVGTSDWQKLELMFNSDDKEELNIAFRLGCYIEEDNAKGKVWFSDIKLEEGSTDETADWNFVCFVFSNIDIDLDGTRVDLSMSNNDLRTIEDNMRRFKKSCEEMTEGKMTADYDIFLIEDPITTISHDEEHGYYVDSKDVKDLIAPYIKQKEYDYIFAGIKLGDNNKNVEIPVNDWIGLRRNGLFGNRFFEHKTAK